MKEEGYSLMELMIVVAFLGIILLIATPLTLQNIRRARAENQVQTLYTNVAEARQRSLQRSMNYLIQVKNSAVDIFEDRNSNGTADAGEKIEQLSVSTGLKYQLGGKVGSTAIGGSVQTATADRKGYIQPSVLIFLDQAAPGATAAGAVQEGPHNCITIDFTRVAIGKYDGTNCQIQ